MSFDGTIPLVGQHWAKERVDMIHNYLMELVEQLSHHKESMLFNAQKLEAHCRFRSKRADESNSEYQAKKGAGINPMYIELINSQNATHAAAISQVTGQLALMACMGVDNMPKVERPEDDEEKDTRN